MSEDSRQDEWQSWREAWQDPGPAGQGPAELPAGLAERVAKVKRSSRRFGLGLMVLTICELLVCAGTMVFVAFYVAQKPTPWRFAMFALAALLVIAAQILTLKNRRGTYRPQNQTTQAFVELEWLRARRQLRTMRWLLPFFAIQMTALAALRLAELAFDPARVDRLPRLALHLGVFSLAAFLVLVLATWIWRRRVRRKMKELEPLRAAFAPPPDPL